jgi:hypothetical protein
MPRTHKTARATPLATSNTIAPARRAFIVGYNTPLHGLRRRRERADSGKKVR